jgi:hypothetical protein
MCLQVGLGVMMENENTSEGIEKIMAHLHEYVPGHDTDTLQLTMCGGDLLSVERASNSQEDKQDSSTPSRKLLGLMPALEDWHTMANFYMVSLFQTGSRETPILFGGEEMFVN